MKEIDEYYYVYILRSMQNEAKIYIGFTTNLAQRLIDHNRGKTTSTRGYPPKSWQLTRHLFKATNSQIEYKLVHLWLY